MAARDVQGLAPLHVHPADVSGVVGGDVGLVGVAAAVAEAGSEAGVGVVRGAGAQAPVAVSVWMLRLQKS